MGQSLASWTGVRLSSWRAQTLARCPMRRGRDCGTVNAPTLHGHRGASSAQYDPPARLYRRRTSAPAHRTSDCDPRGRPHKGHQVYGKDEPPGSRRSNLPLPRAGHRSAHRHVDRAPRSVRAAGVCCRSRSHPGTRWWLWSPSPGLDQHGWVAQQDLHQLPRREGRMLTDETSIR